MNQLPPLLYLSLLKKYDAEKILDEIRLQEDFFASKRSKGYLKLRFKLEEKARKNFIAIGGKPKLKRPYPMTLGECIWIKSWFPNPDVLTIDLESIEASDISFTYGDFFPAFRYNDGFEHYRRVYRLSELPELIKKFGLPQINNPSGEKGPKRYIEPKIWNDSYILHALNRFTQ